MTLGDQVYWWFHGGGSIAKSGHFNWKHYCKVMQAKTKFTNHVQTQILHPHPAHP